MGRPMGAEAQFGNNVWYGAFDDVGKWLHLTFSVAGDGSTLLYVNGTVQASNVQGAGIAGNLDLSSDMYIGQSPQHGLEHER